MSLGQAFTDKYDEQLAEKVVLTEREFAEFNPPSLQVFPSPPKHFRMRAEFKIWHNDEGAHYAMHEAGVSNQPIIIETFDIGSEKICSLMPSLLKEINGDVTLKKKLFQTEFLTSRQGEALITLIYHRPLDDNWLNSAKRLSERLRCKIIGRSRKQKLCVSDDHIVEEFKLKNGRYRYQQVETGFTQPNGFVCEDMLNWAIETSHGLNGDLLELYCGNGNFTLPLAKQFDRVLATEISKTSVKSALYNIECNQATNIKIARISSEEFVEAMQGKREFRRLKDIDLSDYSFNTVFVDPPRAGLDDGTLELVRGFSHILYVSCNPETLKTNLLSLKNSHTIKAFALFDQFPYTEHRECGVLLGPLDS